MAETEQAVPQPGADVGADSGEAASASPDSPGAPSVARETAGGEARGGDDPAATAAAATDQLAGVVADDEDAGDVHQSSEVQNDLDELVAVAAQRDEYLALAQRTQADFENYRKRVARESAAAQERGVAKLARELLPALDNLDRALEAAAAEDPLLEGVRLVRSELAAALARVGIESFSPAGEPFDPEQHEAIHQQPVEGVASGSIAEVYQAGYRLSGTIIRPARVVVAA